MERPRHRIRFPTPSTAVTAAPTAEPCMLSEVPPSRLDGIALARRQHSSSSMAILVPKESDSDLHHVFTHRHIVTSFVCTFGGSSFNDFRVAIFKRSPETSSYQGKWAASSRTLHDGDDPLAAAWAELECGTGLTAADLTLLHAGKPHRFFAADLSRRWTIHPFAFVLRPRARALRINWKHLEHRFVAPEEVETYDTVPDLDITLWRTLTGPDTAEGLRDLREDHVSGARSLATKAVRILLISVTGSDLDWSSNVKSYWRGFRLVAWHLAVNGRPSMGAAIERAVLRAVVLASTRIPRCETVAAAKAVLIEACQATLRERAGGREDVAREFVRYLTDPGTPAPAPDEEVTFLTLSISCAKLCVLEYARHAKGRRIHIIVLESRPGFEGVRMAADLNRQITALLAREAADEAQAHRTRLTAELTGLALGKPNGHMHPSSTDHAAPPLSAPSRAHRIRLTLATDASVGCLAPAVDYVVLGSDRINALGDASNKVGSLSAVLTARAVSRRPVRVIVAAETEKISRLGSPHDALVEANRPDEVAAAWPIAPGAKAELLGSPVVEIVNVFFEWVGGRYVDAYVTEKGVVSIGDIRRQSELAAEEWAEVFENL